MPYFKDRIVLVPLISWAAPASRGECLFLAPSLHYCAKALDFTPDIVVGDMAYINLRIQRQLREKQKVAVITKCKADMNMPEEFDSLTKMTCEQGQRLEWLGWEERDQLHWFGVKDPQPLCLRCWEQSTCPKQFSHSPQEHEIFYGSIPSNSRLARRLLYQCRPWIEAWQAYEKHQLGLSDYFLNSLPLCWQTCLLTDTVALLRARAFLDHPEQLAHPLTEMLPSQFLLPLE